MCSKIVERIVRLALAELQLAFALRFSLLFYDKGQFSIKPQTPLCVSSIYSPSTMSLEFDCDYYHEDPSSLAYELGYAPVYTKLDDSFDPVIRSSFSSPSPSSFEDSSDSSSSDQESDRSFSVSVMLPDFLPIVY